MNDDDDIYEAANKVDQGHWNSLKIVILPDSAARWQMTHEGNHVQLLIDEGTALGILESLLGQYDDATVSKLITGQLQKRGLNLIKGL